MLLRAKQSTGAEDILTANAKLVSPASPPQAPSYPPKALLALLGVAGGMMIAKLTGYILQTTGSYVPVFFIAGTTYLVTLLIVHLLVPKMEPAKL